MTGRRWAAILAAAAAVIVAAGCRGGSRERPTPRLDVERVTRVDGGETIEPTVESKSIGRPDPFLPYVRYLSYRPPPPPPRVDTLPAVLTGAGGPERVGDGHRRRASGIRWNGAVAAIYERDGDPLVVGVGDVVGPPSEEETVTAIGRDWLIVRDRAGVERRVLLGQRPRSGWRGMIED